MSMLAHDPPRAIRAHERRRTFARDVIAGLERQAEMALGRNISTTTAGSELFEQITRAAGILSDPHRARRFCTTTRRRDRALHPDRRRADRVRQRLEPQGAHPAAAPRRSSRPMCRSTSRPTSWRSEAARLRRDLPQLAVLPVAADFTRAVRAAGGDPRARRASASFRARPSAISSRTRRPSSCAMPARMLGPGATFIVGVDLIKDERSARTPPTTMPRASPRSSTSICWRASTASSAAISISPRSATTRSTTASAPHRDASRKPERAERHACAAARRVRAGETIHTENSYKYTVESFQALAASAGWSPVAVWTDPKGYFSRARADGAVTGGLATILKSLCYRHVMWTASAWHDIVPILTMRVLGGANGTQIHRLP